MVFSLATQKVNSGTVGGLSPKTISTSSGAGGGVRAPQINANAGQVGFRASNIPQTVKDQTSDSIQKFSQVALSAAQDFQDRESTYQANQIALAYKEQARKAYEGYDDPEGGFTKGYAHSTGGTAVSEYGAFKAHLESTMMEAVEGLEPRVQQKALIQLSSASNSILGKASTHRSEQLKFAEEQQKAQKLKSVNLDIVSNPIAIFEPDPLTGKTLKGEFYSQFDKQTEADKAWYETMAGTTSLVYQNTYKDVIKQGGGESQALSSAAKQAELYFAGVAGPEMAPDAVASARVLAKLKRWNEEGIASAAQSERTSLERSNKFYKQKQQQVETDFVLRGMAGEPATYKELEVAAKLGYVDSDFLRMHENSYNEVNSGTSNPQDLLDIEARLVQAAADDPNFDPRTIVKSSGNHIQSMEEYNSLLDFGEELKNPMTSSRMRRLDSYAEDMINITDIMGKSDPVQEAQLKSDINKVIRDGIRANLSESDIMDNVQMRLPKLDLDVENSVGFPDGERPESIEELKSTLLGYYQRGSAEGAGYEERKAFEEAKLIYNNRLNAIKAGEKAKARREEMLKSIRGDK